jgi:hypothetical protein
MTWITGLKLGGILAMLAALFGTGYHFGGMASKTALEAQHAAQLQAAVTALDNQASQRVAAEAKLAKVQNDYDAIKDLPDPVSVGLAQRVLYAACPAGGGDVPKAGAVASGALAAAPEPGSDPGLGGRLQAVLDACTADAKQMSAMIELAPK